MARLDAQRSVEVKRFADERALDRAVARGRIDAGLVVPADYDARLRAGACERLRYFARPDSVAQQLSATVQAVAADEARTPRRGPAGGTRTRHRLRAGPRPGVGDRPARCRG